MARRPAALLGILLRPKRDSERLCAGPAISGCGVGRSSGKGKISNGARCGSEVGRST